MDTMSATISGPSPASTAMSMSMSMPISMPIPLPMPTSAAAAAHAFLKDQSHQYLNAWKKRFDRKTVSSSPALAKLDIEYNELANAWRIFQEYLPVEHRLQFQERQQTVADVAGLLRDLQSVWSASPSPRPRGLSRSIILCDRLIACLDNHSTFLAALSGSGVYLSLFYGVLQTIIKASASYPRIIEDLLGALVCVSEAIRLPATTTPCQHPSGVILAVTRFYSITFFFLHEFMNWYTRLSSCQLLARPVQTLADEFKNILRNIRECGNQISRLFEDAMDLEDGPRPTIQKSVSGGTAYLWEEAQLSQIGLEGQERKFAAQTAMTRRLICEMQRDAERRRKLRREGPQLLLGSFQPLSARLRPVEDSSRPVTCIITGAVDHDGKTRAWSDAVAENSSADKPIPEDGSQANNRTPGSKHKLTRTSLQLASKHFEQFLDHDHQTADIDPSAELHTDTRILTGLQEWAVTPRSQILAVGSGSTSTAYPSPVSHLAASCVDCLQQAHIPVLSHICSLPPPSATPSASSSDSTNNAFEQGLIALAYNLIRQLINLLPPVIDCDTTCDLSPERFSRLTGSLDNDKSWNEVLALIEILLRFAPPVVLCVIDGLDVLQDGSTDEFIRSFVGLLLAHTRTTNIAGTNRQNNPAAVVAANCSNFPTSARTGGGGDDDGSHHLFKVLITISSEAVEVPSVLEPLSESRLRRVGGGEEGGDGWKAVQL